MKRILLVAAVLATHAAFAADTLINGSAEAGKSLAATVCAACHMPDGNSVNPVWPSLANQHATYILEQLQAFKSGARQDPLMSAQAQALSEEAMHNVAVWYASQTLRPGTADPALLEKGQRIYQGGIAEENVPACMACHGPAGQGNAAAKYPVIGGQHADYIVLQLKAYAAGTRKTDPNQMMRNIASRLTEEQMRAVASYLQGLAPEPAKQ